MDIPQEFASAAVYDSHEGLRKATLNGIAFEVKPRRRLKLRWPIGWSDVPAPVFERELGSPSG